MDGPEHRIEAALRFALLSASDGDAAIIYVRPEADLAATKRSLANRRVQQMRSRGDAGAHLCRQAS